MTMSDDEKKAYQNPWY